MQVLVFHQEEQGLVQEDVLDVCLRQQVPLEVFDKRVDDVSGFLDLGNRTNKMD